MAYHKKKKKKKNKSKNKSSSSTSSSPIQVKKQTITLCMIVKNESKIISECLDSVVNLIDNWTISDTGSTDGTQDTIKNYFKEKNIPGELHEHKWEDFGINRSQIMKIAEKNADYILVIDADDKLVGNINFPKPLTASAYRFKIMLSPNFSYMRNQLFKSEDKWRYKGVLHEYAYSQTIEQPNIQTLASDFFVSARSSAGSRSQGKDPVQKYSEDSIVLKHGLEKEPKNTRYQFYLAQSYFDSKQFSRSKDAYIKRFNMGGWPEELYYSLYRVAQCNTVLQANFNTIVSSYLNAFAFRPTRAEPLYELSKLFRLNKKQSAVAYTFAKRSAELTVPNDLLFVSSEVYNWRALSEVAATAYDAYQFKEGYNACKTLLAKPGIPAKDMEETTKLLQKYRQKLNY